MLVTNTRKSFLNKIAPLRGLFFYLLRCNTIKTTEVKPIITTAKTQRARAI